MSAENNETNVDLTHNENADRGSSLSFDEIDSMLQKQEEDKNRASRAGKKAKSQEKSDEKVVKEEKNESSKDLKSQESDKKQEHKPKKDLQNSKRLSYLDGEAPGEINPSARFKHKVNGQDVEISLQELLNDFSGKTEWNKRFTDLDKERKAFKNERDVIEKYIQGFYDIAQKGDAIGAMEYLAQLGGLDPLTFKKQLRQQIMPDIEKWQSASEEQRRLAEIEEENAYLKRQRESEMSKSMQQQKQKQLEQELKQIQEVHKIDDEALVQYYDALASHYKPEEITPDLLVEYAKQSKAFDRAELLIKEVDESLLSNDKVVSNIVDLLLQDSYQDEELLDIISNSFAKRYGTKKRSPVKQAEFKDKILEKNEHKQLQPSIHKIPQTWDDI
jgi:hypothetical protein